MVCDMKATDRRAERRTFIYLFVNKNCSIELEHQSPVNSTQKHIKLKKLIITIN